MITPSPVFNLGVGGQLQIEPADNPEGARHDVTLIGYMEPYSVMVSWPQEQGSPVELNVGDPLTVGFEAGDNHYSFTTEITQTCAYPFPYLHLAFPEGVQHSQVRRTSRFPVNDLAMMLVMEEHGQKMSVALADISLAGARLVSGSRLGEVGERFSIEIPHRGLTGNERVVLPCEVRYVREEMSVNGNGGKRVYHHGVEFARLSKRALAFIERYIGDKVVEQRGAQV